MDPLLLQQTLELHLKRKTRRPAKLNRIHLPETGADHVVLRENRVAVEQVEAVDLERERLLSRPEVLLDVHVELVVSRIVKRSRFVQDEGLGVGTAAWKRGGRGGPGDDPR